MTLRMLDDREGRDKQNLLNTPATGKRKHIFEIRNYAYREDDKGKGENVRKGKIEGAYRDVVWVVSCTLQSSVLW